MSLEVRRSYESVARGDDAEAVQTYRRIHHLDEKGNFVKGYEVSKFFEIIIVYTNLRESTQREEAPREKLEELRERKARDPNNEHGQAELEQLEAQINDLRRRIW